MSIQAIAWALKLNVKPAAAKLLLISIANYADDRNAAWPSKSTLARDCSLDKSGVCRHLLSLQDMGLVTITERQQDGCQLSSMITLHTDAMSGRADATSGGTDATPKADGTDAFGGGASTTGVVASAHETLSRQCDTNLKIEPSLNPKGAQGGNSFWKKSLNPQADHGVQLTDDGSVTLINGTRADWLAKFGDDATALDLALGELVIQPESREGLRKQVERQLSRIARMRHDSEQRFRQSKAPPKSFSQQDAERQRNAWAKRVV